MTGAITNSAGYFGDDGLRVFREAYANERNLPPDLALAPVALAGICGALVVVIGWLLFRRR